MLQEQTRSEMYELSIDECDQVGGGAIAISAAIAAGFKVAGAITTGANAGATMMEFFNSFGGDHDGTAFEDNQGMRDSGGFGSL